MSDNDKTREDFEKAMRDTYPGYNFERSDLGLYCTYCDPYLEAAWQGYMVCHAQNQQESAASQAREAELREKLARKPVTCLCSSGACRDEELWRKTVAEETESLREQLEAAEAKLKEISEAPVVATIKRLNGATVDLNLGSLGRHVVDTGKELELKIGDELIIRPKIKKE